MLPESLRPLYDVAIPALFICFQRFLFHLEPGAQPESSLEGRECNNPFSLHSAFISIIRFLRCGAGSRFPNPNGFKRPQLTAKIAATSAMKLGSSRSQAVPS
jgi:hypothetical protein